MQSSYLPSELEELESRIIKKRETYYKAMKEDLEFKFVRAIYREMKALEKEYQQALNSLAHLQAPMRIHQVC